MNTFATADVGKSFTVVGVQQEFEVLVSRLSRLEGLRTNDPALDGIKGKLSQRIAFLIAVEMEQLNPSKVDIKPGKVITDTGEIKPLIIPAVQCGSGLEKAPRDMQQSVVPGKLIR